MKTVMRRSISGVRREVCGAAFKALVNDFGWPIIESWLAFERQPRLPDLHDARFMTLNRWTIPPDSDLAALPVTTGFGVWDISRWQGISVNASRQRPCDEQEVYRIGYLARIAAAADVQL